MVRNGEIIAQHYIDNILPSKCAYKLWQTIVHFLSGSATLNDRISCVQPLYICSKFYR